MAQKCSNELEFNGIGVGKVGVGEQVESGGGGDEEDQVDEE